MFEYGENISVYTPPENRFPFSNSETDYSEVLKFYNLSYKQSGYYWQVGEISKVQGWILHISVVVSQIMDLLKATIDLLIVENVPFKIAIDKDTARFLLNGYLGTPQIGKILSIYPNDDIQAVLLAKELIILTKNFKGPSIPTDCHLGSIVYTRYGSFNPIIKADAQGKEDKYIYDNNGNLIKDPYCVPFDLPTGIIWPFSELTFPVVFHPKKILNNNTKLLDFLKKDLRGNVYKGLYLKGIFRAVNCVVKQGKQNMGSEENGRDIFDKLQWQYNLHKELYGKVPLPKVFDLFEEDGDMYLVLEFIKGIPLYEQTKQIRQQNNWLDLSIKDRILLLNCFIKIISEVEVLHQNGFVHRDIQPSNFLISNGDNIVLIDLELAWSLSECLPNPPFELGTAGFMSPEQHSVQIPTIKEDIYGIGALMVFMFIGISPVKFAHIANDRLPQHISFFLGNTRIADIIASCLDTNPERRPNLSTILTEIELFKKDLLQTTIRNKVSIDLEKLNIDYLRVNIQKALNGLVNSPMVISEDLWCSKNIKTSNRQTPEQKEFTKYIGLFEGLSGVLFVLARAEKLGFDCSYCSDNYQKSWKYIETTFQKDPSSAIPGLYYGSAGIAIAMAEGVKSGKIQNSETTRMQIQQYLSFDMKDLGLRSGVTGQGIALLQCDNSFSTEERNKLLKRYVNLLCKEQKRDGSWEIIKDLSVKESNSHLFSCREISGICYFLLEYTIEFDDDLAKNAAIRGLSWLSKHMLHTSPSASKKIGFSRLKKTTAIAEELKKTVFLTFVKAYECLKEPYFKSVVETELHKIPANIISNDFTKDTGLSGLGEVYLEAARVFNSEVWQKRAEWIAHLFINTYSSQSEDAIYWQTEDYSPPTADLYIGNSGIIHFLLQISNPIKIGKRLLI